MIRFDYSIIAWLFYFFFLGYIKARETSIMDYVHAYDRKRNVEFLFRQKNSNLFFILVQSSLPLPTIHFLSLIDCSQTLAKVAQTVCQQVKQGEIISDSIQIDTIDRCYTSKRK